MVKLVNANASEKVFNYILLNNDSNNSIQYTEKDFYILMKNNYLAFRDNIFSNKMIILSDNNQGNIVIIENQSKTNVSFNNLIIKYLDCNEKFLKESLEFLESIFYSKNIKKIKISCFVDEIECLEGIIKDGYLKKELSYKIGLNDRVHMAHIFG